MLTINGITNDYHKLTFFRSHGAGHFTIPSGATTFDALSTQMVLWTLNSGRIIYTRQQVLLCKQRVDACITAFLPRLRIFNERSERTHLTVQQHKYILLRNDIVSVLKSDAIRVRLLELADSDAALEKCISFANAIEVTDNFDRSFNASSETPPSTSSPSVGNIAAVKK